jgi:Tautomerase enzyme.
MNSATAHRSSRAMAMRLGNLRTKSRSVWSESTFRSRADGIPFFRWMESVDLRRPLHARPGRRSLLYPVENDHEPLADRHSSWCRIRNADDVLIATTDPLRTHAAGTVRRWSRATVTRKMIMPLLCFDLIAGRSENQIKRILDVTHEVMVNAFNVPERDRYQIVREHLPSRMIVEDTGSRHRANC